MSGAGNESLDITKPHRSFKGDQPRNCVERGGMRCTETQHLGRQTRGFDKTAQQNHQSYANYGAGDDVAWPMISEKEQWPTDCQRCPNGCGCAKPA